MYRPMEAHDALAYVVASPLMGRFFEAGEPLEVIDLAEGNVNLVFRVRSTRLVSLTRRSLLAIRYRVQSLDRPLRVVVQSELVANEEQPPPSDDPRVAAALTSPLVAVSQDSEQAE